MNELATNPVQFTVSDDGEKGKKRWGEGRSESKCPESGLKEQGHHPTAPKKIIRLVWRGGDSSGRGLIKPASGTAGRTVCQPGTTSPQETTKLHPAELMHELKRLTCASKENPRDS